jgi:Flp pilus assembly protein TadB
VSGKGEALSRANDVSATVIALDASRVLVRLDATLAGSRASIAQINAGLGGATVVAGGVLAALSFPVLAAVAPAALLVPIVWGASRSSHARNVERAQLALEQVLDRLERGEAGRPPTLMSMLAAAVARGR